MSSKDKITDKILNEEWRNVPGYEGLYQVSNLGRVKRNEIRKMHRQNRHLFLPSKIMKQRLDSHGYYIIGLVKDGKQYTSRVHRIVAQAFIPNVNGYPEIDHINTVRKDNQVNNLRWCTRKENMMNSITFDRIISSETGCMRQLRPVSGTSKYGRILNFNSMQDAARFGSFDRTAISACCRGKRKSHKGFVWKYA